MSITASTLVASEIVGLGRKLIDRLIPDKEGQAKAKAELAQMEQDGELKQAGIQMSAIVMEAKSEDPWTSRARPSFLYVMYAMILSSIPMGALNAWKPDVAASVANGMQLWLAAIPESMWALFGVGYLGYSAARSVDKRKKAGEQ